MKITIEMVMDENPCEDYPESRVAELFNGREYLTPRDVSELDIPVDDRIWLLGRLLGRHDPTRVVARRIARDALGDREIPDAYQKWLDTGDENLRPAASSAARSAASYAAWDAARDAWAAARDAARSAAWAAARSAAWYAAWDAARDAASSAARDAAWQKYLGWMVEFLEVVK